MVTSVETGFASAAPTWRRNLMLTIRLLVALVILGVIVHNVDFTSVLARLSAATGWAFAAGVFILFGQLILCTARWRLLLEPIAARPRFVDSYLAFLEGQFFNHVLPSTVGGDAWRVVRWRRAGVSLRSAIASVFMDRLSGAMGAAILAMVAAAILSHHGVEISLTLPIFLLGALVICGIATFVLLLTHPRILPFRRLARFHGEIAKLQDLLVLDARYVASLGYSIAGHCLCGIAVYVIARTLGIDLSLVLIVGVTAAVLLILMIPISLGGWGMREASFITLLAPLGVNSQDALLIGILFGLMNLFSALPGGFSLMASRRTKYRSGERTIQSP